jgi:threonine synthase
MSILVLSRCKSAHGQRGKTLQKHEIEALQSIVLQEKEGIPSHLEVLDYAVTMRKEGLVEASVKLRLHGVEVESEAKGVGPIDAVLAAIRTHSDTHCKILVKNHEVDILSPQTDSLVVVTLTLEHEGRQIRPKGASSDTLEAVIHAFEKGYSVLAEQLVHADQLGDQQTTDKLPQD